MSASELISRLLARPRATSASKPDEKDAALEKRCDGTRKYENIMDLPTELHILISKELMYPDALSLKHVSRHFYHLVDTGVNLKIEWLLERRSLHLDCPNDVRCDLRSDLKFCRGSVKLLMQRRREHFECESRPGLGCLIYGTPRCRHARDWRIAVRRWMRREVRIEYGWMLVAMAVAWLCVLLQYCFGIVPTFLLDFRIPTITPMGVVL